MCVSYFNSGVSLRRTEGKDGIKNKGVMCDHMQSIFNHLSFLALYFRKNNTILWYYDESKTCD